MTDVTFHGQVAIVTGAGAGLGRSHALALAARGATVIVNDLGGRLDGSGAGSDAAHSVVAEIEAMGGSALANGADVYDAEQVRAMVDTTINTYGRIDILINNAGILRDKTFAKMTMADFQAVIDVHLTGSANCTHAVWPHMIKQGYGRILFTTSASGLYGNFGQSNYGAAKAALLGLMNVLAIEGAKFDIRTNMLAPSAATRMTEDLLSADVLALMQPETITPGVLALVSQFAPNKMIMGAGAGCFAEIQIRETAGVALKDDELTPENVLAALPQIRDPATANPVEHAFAQTRKFARMAAAARGLPLPWNE